LLAIIVVLLNFKFIQFEKFFILLLIIIFFAGTILSLYHLGIEQGFIQESLVCDLKSGSNLLSKEEILKQLQEKSVSCKDVTFKIFGLSLTSYNILISLLITISAGKIYFNYDKNYKKKVEEFIRVDHAGERGAVKIYEGQTISVKYFCKR
jgi:disulfide bond formation protein DsbB